MRTTPKYSAGPLCTGTNGFVGARVRTLYSIDIVVEGSDSFIGNLGYSDRRQQLMILALLTFVIWGLESAFDYIAAVTWRNISRGENSTLHAL